MTYFVFRKTIVQKPYSMQCMNVYIGNSVKLKRYNAFCQNNFLIDGFYLQAVISEIVFGVKVSSF